MLRNFVKQTLIPLLALVVIMSGLTTGAASAAGFSPNPSYVYLVGSTIWQLSAESQALMQQAFTAARGRIAELALRCADSTQPDWHYEESPDGNMNNVAFTRFVLSDAALLCPER